MDLQGSEFALFERATLLEAEVRKRTTQVEQAMAELQRSQPGPRGGEGCGRCRQPLQDPLPRRGLARPAPAAQRGPAVPVRPGRDRAAGERRPLVENVELAFELIDRLLSALLDISKLDAGVVTPEIDDVPLGPLLRRLVAEFAPLAERKGLTLRLRADHGGGRAPTRTCSAAR